MTHFLLICCLTLISVSAWANEDLQNREQGECRVAAKRYLFLSDYKIECDDNYILFEAKDIQTKKKSKIEMAAFNILRTGTDQTLFKDYEYLAKMINQWDLVGVVEIMPIPHSQLKYNSVIDDVRVQLMAHQENYNKTQYQKYLELLDASYEKPGFIKILEALKRLDDTWSLILAPKPTGDNPASYELSGFYYRASVVENRPTAFCGDNRGCLLPVRSRVQKLISRIPFTARFVAGDLDFNAVAVHMRYREPAPDCSEVKAGEDCLNLTNSEKGLVNDFSVVGNKKERYRFIELAIINDSMKESRSDFVIMGDFNLDYEPKKRGSDSDAFWRLALNDDKQKVLIEEKTSISEKYGLSNPYDHFVIDSHENSSLKLCDTNSAKAFNFLIEPKQKVPSALKPMASFLKARDKSNKSLLEKFIEDVKNKLNLAQCGSNECETETRFSNSEIDDLSDYYWRRVLIDSEKDDGEVNHFPYRVHIELISDHLPIHMSCNTSKKL